MREAIIYVIRERELLVRGAAEKERAIHTRDRREDGIGESNRVEVLHTQFGIENTKVPLLPIHPLILIVGGEME